MKRVLVMSPEAYACLVAKNPPLRGIRVTDEVTDLGLVPPITIRPDAKLDFN